MTTAETSGAATADDEPLVDWAVALESVGGDPELLLEVIEAFLIEGPQQLAAIHSSFQAGDAKTLHRAAHTLKGSMRYFGARRLFETALQLELLSDVALRQSQSLSEAAPLIARLDSQLPALTAALTEYLRSRRRK